MSIYNYNANTVAEQLTPPVLRKTKFLQWLYVIVSPIQNLWSLIFEDYKDGSNYNYYNNYSTGYLFSIGERVIFTYKVYECYVSHSKTSTFNPNNWIEVNPSFIGANERVLYNSQKLLFEYNLNKYFNTTTPNVIYLTNNFTDADVVFLMANTPQLSSLMSSNSINSIHYLGNVPNYVTIAYDFTVNVPLTLFNSLGTNTINRENAIRQIVDKYKLVGTQYNVITY